MKPLLIILGPTASGKTHLATQIAHQMGGEIISVDSRQVYRNMNIGTGKDLDEYRVNGNNIPYHLIDIKEAGEQYNVNEFQKDFKRTYDDLAEGNSVPILCGGTGFYIYALLKGHAFSSIPVDNDLRIKLEIHTTEELNHIFQNLNSAYSGLADTSTRKRLIRAIEISQYLIQNPSSGSKLVTTSVKYQSVIFGLNPPVDVRRERISSRLKYRLENGLIDEVEALMKSGISAEQLIYYGLEYKFVTQFLLGELIYKDMARSLESEIHRFAKRQMTFFRKMEKDGITINWINHDLPLTEQIEMITGKYNKILV
ncbi:tRNA (adenosine(37)-N6)-dimethylallyltransferase MiaA [Dyadobacter sp. NIV53]|uniref:tRNA (adenosine(37)-N6)-dimethylallyltransferase MiaA n=1 Tax=Dyadobacter sp. NIV53 TaxID=2861765 RepID=UPI001E529859|nr:tRNA (adenosine(37)-N6)-dimethylallyltransferase MiaA [Dyadobacter sp. NIV53]